MLYILLDADMLCFVSCSSVEREIDWGDGLWTLHADAKEAETQVDDRVESITTAILDKLNYEGEYRILMCLSDPERGSCLLIKLTELVKGNLFVMLRY